MEFEEGRDTEGVLEGVELGGLLGDSSPRLEGFAFLVGIGEENYLVSHQGLQELGLEHLEAAAREPQGIGKEDAANDSGFLGFDYTNHGVIVFDHGFAF